MEKNSLSKFTKTALETIVTLREQHRMTLSGSSLYCTSVLTILECFIQQLEERISQDRPDLHSYIKREARHILLQNPLSEVSSEHKIMKCLKEFCGYVEPIELTMGVNYTLPYGNNNEKIQDIEVGAMVVPFVNQLSQILKNNEIYKFCFESPIMPSTDNVIRNVKDGTIFKTHPVCTKYPNCLLLQMYEDDVEVCNALGSHTKKHKVTVVYWSILNLPEHIRSNLKSLHLLGVAKSTSIKEFGFEVILDDFLESVLKLESPEGLNVEIGEGKIVNLHGTLIAVNGDGLALNSIGGFKEGIGFANKPCRNCDMDKIEIRQVFFEDRLRNLSDHRERVRKLLDENLSKKDKEEISKEFGICSASVFSKLSNFDLTKCLCQDLMHNFMEGAEEVEIRALLFELIENQKILSFEDLNYLLSGFPYPKQFSGCKPSSIERTHVLTGKLRQNASQMICLLYVLPLILEPFANGPSKEHVKNFSLLGKIGNILLSYEVERDMINFLRFMICEHHTKYSELYQNYPITPKFHFLVHAPTMIDLFGPSRISWTMRYEALNAWVSKIGEETRNFKNLPKTLATRFQVKKCLDFHFGDENASVIGCKSFMTENLQSVDIQTYRLGEEVARKFGFGVKDLEGIGETNQICILNFEININSILMLENNEETLPVFGQVKAIFVKDQACVLVFQSFETDNFNQVTNCYEVTETNSFACMLHNTVPFLHPLPCVRTKGKINVILQYHCRTEYFGE